MWITLYESFEQMNMGLWEFHKKIRYETAMSDFQLLSLDYNQICSNFSNTRVIIIKFIRPESLVIFTGKRIYGHHIAFAISKSNFATVFNDLKNARVIVFRPIIADKFKIYWLLNPWPPYWIRHYKFCDPDYRFVIYNPKSLGNYTGAVMPDWGINPAKGLSFAWFCTQILDDCQHKTRFDPYKTALQKRTTTQKKLFHWRSQILQGEISSTSIVRRSKKSDRICRQ